MQYSKAIIAKAFFQKSSLLGVEAVTALIEQLELFQSAVSRLHLIRVFKNPELTAEQKIQILTEICHKLKIKPENFPYLETLVKIKALHFIRNIVFLLKKLRQKKFDLIEGVAVSASKLETNQRTEIEQLLKKLSGCEKIILFEQVEKNTLGGVSLLIQDFMLDLTIQNKLNNLSKIIS